MDNKLPDPNEVGKIAAKGVVWSSARTFGGKLISFIVYALLSRLVSPEDFGLLTLSLLLINFSQIFLDQGFGDAIVQRLDLDQEHLDTAFWTNLLLGSMLTLLTIAVAPVAANIFSEPSLRSITPWLALSFIFSGLSSTQEAILRRQLGFKQLAQRKLIATFIGGVIAIVMALFGFGVWSLVALELASRLIGVIVLWNVSDWRPQFRFSRAHFKELFSFGLNIIGIKFLNYLNQHTDDLLIGYYLGTTMLGFYSIAYRLLETMTDLLTTIINSVAMPTFSRLQNDYGRVHSAFYISVSLTSVFSFPIFIGSVLLAPELIITIFGDQWAPSIPVAQILPFIGILHSVFYFHDSLLVAMGKPSIRLGNALLNAITNVIAFAIAVRWGIVAVAAAYVLRGYFLIPVELWMVRFLARVNLKHYFKQFINPLIGTIIMSSIVIGLGYFVQDVQSTLLRLITLTLAGGTVYLLAVYFLEPKFISRTIESVRSGFTVNLNE